MASSRSPIGWLECRRNPRFSGSETSVAAGPNLPLDFPSHEEPKKVGPSAMTLGPAADGLGPAVTTSPALVGRV